MNQLLKQLFGIREREVARSYLMFAYIFLIISALLIVKPAAYSLFLSQFGAHQLPVVFVAVAVVSVLVAIWYSRVTNNLSLNRTISRSLIVYIVSLLLFRLLFHNALFGGALIYLFFLWVAIFGILSASQFWLLARYVFDVREAKRVYGFIGLGAITGGISGGYLTNFLTPLIGSMNLLFVSASFLFICFFLLRFIRNTSARHGYGVKSSLSERKQTTFQTSDPLKLITSSSHLKSIALLTAVGIFIANLVDYIFSSTASAIITDPDSLTAFFGLWSSNISVFALLIQLMLTSKLLKTFGVGTSLFILPVGVMVGAISVVFAPGLFSALLIRINEGSLKHSLNKASLELLMLSIPSMIARQTKAFIDVFVTNAATGISGILLILMTTILDLDIRYIALLTLVVCMVWIVLAVKGRREYINAFKSAIKRRIVDINAPNLNLTDAVLSDMLKQVLESQNEKQIIYILQLLEGSTGDENGNTLMELMSHPSPEVKKRILRIALNLKETDFSKQAESCLSEADEDLRIAAIRYLVQKSADKIDTLMKFIVSEDWPIKSAALICAAREYRHQKSVRESMELEELYDTHFVPEQMTSGDTNRLMELHIAKAKFIREVRVKELSPQLRDLLEYPDMAVKKAAIKSAGKLLDRVHVPVLIELLDNNRLRGDVIDSLAAYGNDIIEDLRTHLEDVNVSYHIRLTIPRILYEIGSQRSVNLLIRNLELKDERLNLEVLKALNKIRRKFTGVKFHRRHIRQRLQHEINSYYDLLSLLFEFRSSNEVKPTVHSSISLSDKAICEKLAANFERIFRLLGLLYSPTDIYNGYIRISVGDSSAKTNAIEFLDNLIDPHLRGKLVPIMEAVTPQNIEIKDLQGLCQQSVLSKGEYKSKLLNSGDPILTICGLYDIAQSEDFKYIEAVNDLKTSGQSLIRETAEYALHRLEKAA